MFSHLEEQQPVLARFWPNARCLTQAKWETDKCALFVAVWHTITSLASYIFVCGHENF